MEKKWWTLAAVAIGAFMLLLDLTIVNVALPDIEKQLHASFSDLPSVIDVSLAGAGLGVGAANLFATLLALLAQSSRGADRGMAFGVLTLIRQKDFVDAPEAVSKAALAASPAS